MSDFPLPPFLSSHAPRDPVEVVAMAEGLLRLSSYRALRGVSATYRDGVLTLRGQLASYDLRHLAQALVSDVDGVSAVDNQIVFRSPRDWPPVPAPEGADFAAGIPAEAVCG